MTREIDPRDCINGWADTESQFGAGIVMYDSPEAARYVTGISGWVDRYGYFYGENEHLARYSGSTHKVCKCGEVIRANGYCRSCHEKAEVKRYNEMPRMTWDHETPLYSQITDKFFFDEDSLRDYLYDTGLSVRDLRLVICNPVKLRQIDESYFCDELAEDQDLPDEIYEALEALNEAIRNSDPVSWEPGKYAAYVTGEQE